MQKLLTEQAGGPPYRAVRLPESDHCLQVMLEKKMVVADRIGSKLIPYSFFEEVMQLKRDSMAWTREMIRLQGLLLSRGFVLVERGMRSKGYRLIPIQETGEQVSIWDRKSKACRVRSAILIRAVLRNHQDVLTPEEVLDLKKKEENNAVIMAFEHNRTLAKKLMSSQTEKIRAKMTARVERRIENHTTSEANDPLED